MRRSAIALLTVFISTSILITACGGPEEPKAKPVDTATTANKPAENNNVPSKQAGVTDERKLTAKSDLTSEEINALYNEPSIEINGFKRYLSSLNTLDYLRGTNEARVSAKFFTKIESNRKLLQEKDKLVVLVPTDAGFDASGRARLVEQLISSEDTKLQQKALYNHVYKLKGKYIGGDFISIENMKNQKISQIQKIDGAWYLKDIKLNGEPALVENGIVFMMDTDFFPGN